jgi:hypothetical protein
MSKTRPDGAILEQVNWTVKFIKESKRENEIIKFENYWNFQIIHSAY